MRFRQGGKPGVRRSNASRLARDGRRVEWIDDPARFHELEPEWDELVELHRTPFLRHRWIRSWWEAFGGRRRLAIIALWERDELAALFPIARRGRNLDGLAGPAAPDFRPFGRSASAVRAVVDAALAVRPSTLSLYAVPTDDVAADALDAAARQQRFVVARERMQVSPYVPCVGSYSQYLAGLNRDVRRVATARKRSLESDHDVVWTVWATSVDLPRELDEALALENSGWKRSQGGAVLSSPGTAAFYHEFARAFNIDGRFALAKLQVDGRLAAVVIGLVDFDRFWLLKTAYDESLRRYSPGMMLALAITEHCFELGFDAFELLGDLTEWKRRLHPQTRTFDTFRLYRRRPLPLAMLGYRRYLYPPLRRGAGRASAYVRARAVGG
jgi:CelD/BcsL family acetyltransferase involved in cellulose biosynthesis